LAEALRPHAGRWVAVSGDGPEGEQPTEILAVGDSPEELVQKLRELGIKANGGMFRVPEPDAPPHAVELVFPVDP
jgi:hypothetical protein